VARITVPKLEASSFKGWTFVLVAGVVLALLAIIDRGGLGAITVANGSTGCQLEVVADELNVRNGPSPRVDGTKVVTDGFRELEEGRWAADQFLAPLPGSDCA
jgi:hypothetical protein